MKIQNKILNIERDIWENFEKKDNIGLYLGLSGFVLFYDHLYELYPCNEFGDKLLIVIEKANTLIQEQQNSASLCSGLAGYGLILLRLKNQNINIDEEYFESIDSFLIEEFEALCKSNDFDFMHESMGIAMYFIERYKSNNNTQVSENLKYFGENLINKINTDFQSVLVKSDNARGEYYSFGLAHGVASYLNFLIYLKKHFALLTSDISGALRVCAAFLNSYKKYDNQSKQYYANVISIKTNNVIPSRLSWCQGDLGVSNALYNTGTYLNDEVLINEAIALMNHSASINFEDSGINDFGFCHGSAGILIQFYLAARKYNIDYSKQITHWYSVLKEQTEDFGKFFWFENSTSKYIPESNLLVGSAGLGLVLLTVENGTDPTWLELFNLH